MQDQEHYMEDNDSQPLLWPMNPYHHMYRNFQNCSTQKMHYKQSVFSLLHWLSIWRSLHLLSSAIACCGAVAAKRRCLLHGACSMLTATDRYLLPTGRSAANPLYAADDVDRWDRWMDRWTLNRDVDHALHTMLAESIISNIMQYNTVLFVMQVCNIHADQVYGTGYRLKLLQLNLLKPQCSNSLSLPICDLDSLWNSISYLRAPHSPLSFSLSWCKITKLKTGIPHALMTIAIKFLLLTSICPLTVSLPNLFLAMQ